MKKFIFIMLGFSLTVAGFISWFASPSPDGLEKVAETHGFIGKALEPVYKLFPDYTIPGINGFWSNFLSGIIGTLITFGFIYVILKLIRKKKTGRNLHES
jgi:cobalt/nickel transport protein